jgi:hypothetical protein
LKSLLSAVFGTMIAVSVASAQAPKWDRIANIKEMGTHIGTLQRNQGADKAMSFIDACYRTHSLGSVFSKSFEGCIAADYMLAQALVAVINRVPPEELRKSGSAVPADIIKAVQSRIHAGFGQYGMDAAQANAFLALVDTHGMPTFLSAVFPKAAPRGNP